eukprot:TRINITY_DN33346_c0_g2_i2.p1 TRINITY_DN33346_c0_g2~~TRINITY_DN33346_c0_g2_i2.p1  ORF type:complete len:137 (-),score=21.42 TRINITY_DN33346_c0_g2_i2:222-632(-)
MCIRDSPYIVAVFVCPNLPLLLGVGIIVEVANVPSNFEWFLENEGRTDSKFYGVTLYVTWLSWLIFRVIIPTYGMYGMYRYVLPYHGTNISCYLSTCVSGHLIFIFCTIVFATLYTPKVYRWHFPVAEESTAKKVE